MGPNKKRYDWNDWNRALYDNTEKVYMEYKDMLLDLRHTSIFPEISIYVFARG